MSRSNHPRKIRKKPGKPRPRPADGWDCPICNPDIKLVWFLEKQRAADKKDLRDRMKDLE